MSQSDHLKPESSKIMKKRKWPLITNNLTLLLLGLQDASYMAENMVLAAESLGMGSCFLGEGSLNAKRIKHLAEKHKLPNRVLPMVELVRDNPDKKSPSHQGIPWTLTYFKINTQIFPNPE